MSDKKIPVIFADGLTCGKFGEDNHAHLNIKLAKDLHFPNVSELSLNISLEQAAKLHNFLSEVLQKENN
ncbi:hypothetical protein [Xenorhabdus sp. PB30.3]|uniref:hypothetical protein n=1 Tax=Xenorhabdus sp. PB30.3 TaxID=2788941 RepID=UPI001E374F43|nr:hypothetical protein [Xenorhabdus sp. PB30.3]MCC8379544.1 hypothetical protein [Xenorhabdus sp. PB30.3]